MTLHTDAALFSEILDAASQSTTEGGLGIEKLFIEKDYWISKVLKQLSIIDKEQRAIFKGGTSLSKVYGIGNRFSEDIEINNFRIRHYSTTLMVYGHRYLLLILPNYRVWLTLQFHLSKLCTEV